MNWYLGVLKKYAVFSGRARRKEYWMFFLVNFIILLLLGLIEAALGLPAVLTFLYTLAVLIPHIAVGVRRLHDTGRSGWWLLLSLVPLVGIFIVLFFLILDGQPGENSYGPNPKGA